MQVREVDVAIIGTGTAGMGAYRAASQFTKSIALIEGAHYGTTCARVGCMPSKLLISAADAARAVSKSPIFGVYAGQLRIDGAEVMARVRSERDRFVGFVVQSIGEEFDAAHRIFGTARFVDDHSLAVGDDLIVKAKRIVIATGSRPAYPSAWSELGDRLVVNDDVFSWTDLPASVAVFGGGVVGLELGQALHRLGVRVRHFGKDGVVGMLSDPKVRAYASEVLTAQYAFDPSANVTSVKRDGDSVVVRFVEGGKTKTETFDYLLAATGRRPNVDQLGLENTNLPRDAAGVPVFDPGTGRVGDTHVFIAGDANADRTLLHEAADEGRIAGENAGRFPDVRVGKRRAGLGVVFCDPQIAVAGESYAALKTRSSNFVVGEVSYDDQGRARVAGKNKGLLRMYAEQGTGVFLGAEMMAPSAEHLAHLLAWSAQGRLTVDQMLDRPFYHPTLEEGVRTGLRVLLRNLRLGPPPVKRCMDCGPGA